MKRVMTLVLSLVLVCGLAISAAAVGFDMETDKDIIQAGEDVTVTITLDETIPVSKDATALEGDLFYDGTVLDFKSVEKGESYSFLTAAKHKKQDMVLFSWVSMTNTAMELPAGTMVVVTFTAKKDMDVAVLETELNLTSYIATSTGEYLNNKNYSTSIKVCAGHTWDEGTGTHATCTEDGEMTYTCTACGATKIEKEGATGHQKLNYVEAKAATCTEDGNIEYWHCEDCGKYWTDKELTNEVKTDDLVVPAGHQKLNYVEAKAATCTEDGNIEHWHCEACGKYWTDKDLTNEVKAEDVVVPGGHKKVDHVEAKAATCTDNGNIEYWHCEDCGKYWTDKDLTNEVKAEDVVIPANHKKLNHVEAKDATCTEDGNIEYWHCEDCGKYWSDKELTKQIEQKDTVIAAGHDLVHINAVDAKCHFTGNLEHWYCVACDTIWTDKELTQVAKPADVIVPALGGEVIHVEAKAESCLKDGNIEYWHCEECKQIWTDKDLTKLLGENESVVVPAHGHKYGPDGICTICGDNPKAADSTMIGVIIVAAMVSALTVVVLPVVKKRF